MLLKENKYLVHDFDHFSMTALHWCAKKGHCDIIKLLIKYGADYDAEDYVGRRALHFAIMKK